MLENREKIELRDYQQDMLNKIVASFQAGNDVCFQMTTGTGKSIVLHALYNWLVRHGYNKVAICTPRDNIRQQLIQRINTEHVYNYTMSSKKLPKFSEGGWVILIDECHHTKCDSIQNKFLYCCKKVNGEFKTIRQGQPNCNRFIGCSATPSNYDYLYKKYKFEGLYTYTDIIQEKYNIFNYQDHKYLNTFEFEKCYDLVTLKELSKLNVKNGEYKLTNGDAQILIDITKIKNILKENNGKFILFGFDTDYMTNLCKEINIPLLTATTNDGVLIEQMRKGIIRGVGSINIINEGFDIPDLDFIICCRPSLLKSVIFQQIGRLTRYKSDTPKIIYDFVNVREFFNKKINCKYVLESDLDKSENEDGGEIEKEYFYTKPEHNTNALFLQKKQERSDFCVNEFTDKVLVGSNRDQQYLTTKINELYFKSLLRASFLLHLYNLPIMKFLHFNRRDILTNIDFYLNSICILKLKLHNRVKKLTTRTFTYSNIILKDKNIVVIPSDRLVIKKYTKPQGTLYVLQNVRDVFGKDVLFLCNYENTQQFYLPAYHKLSPYIDFESASIKKDNFKIALRKQGQYNRLLNVY